MRQEFRIEHPQNEASGLLGIQSRAVLRELGWERGFWIVSDEQDASRAVAALGRGGDGSWAVVPLRARGPAPRKRTEDAETLARAGSWVYVVGSQYAAKEGPLEPRRHFVARFDEALVEARGGAMRARVEVARRPFLLHRLVNDALARFRVKVLGAGSAVHAEYVEPVRKKGEAKRKRWAELLHA